MFNVDLLENNYLEDSPLSLVSSVDDIEEIWQQLQSAYGDPKIILNSCSF